MAGATGLDEAIEYHVVNSLGWHDLRPLQRDAVGPVRSGADCLLLAPTAGGKTEAAIFPLMSEMVEQDWQGLSVLYVAPLRALINNLHPRLEQYGTWLGRTVGLWHGDVDEAPRNRIRNDPPDILLTTPESLEAMLVSRKTDHGRMFGALRAIVVDELHSFASSDRGWHLLAVLERLQRITGRAVQRVGLSATVGNPQEIAAWMQGSSAGRRDLKVVTEVLAAGAPRPDVGLDYVGSVANAARVIASLHAGEKRLVFCESRKVAEGLAFDLREMGVETFVSHSSLAAAERRRSEQAFAEARDCVIVATSTLELGIDIGDLDRVVQIDAPRTVASFLQRLGRTGRRPGTVRNTLFLATDLDTLLEAAGLLVLWNRGYVEPVVPPPHPKHLVAQQLLALALQEGAYGLTSWSDWWASLPMMDDADQVLEYLIAEKFLLADGGLLMIGPRAEQEFGRRHFMDLLSSFNVEKELRVVAGNQEVGFVSPLSLPSGTGSKETVKPLLLNGRAWRIESVDWKAFEVLVAPEPMKGDVRWETGDIALSFEFMRAQRDVLLGTDPDVELSRRAAEWLAQVRERDARTVSRADLVEEVGEKSTTWFTWAGLKANETLRAALGSPDGRSSNRGISMQGASMRSLSADAVVGAVPVVPQEMVDALKFSAALPPATARETVAERFADRAGAARVLEQ
jgi:ATP-dependent Lhr-like helicase